MKLSFKRILPLLSSLSVALIWIAGAVEAVYEASVPHPCIPVYILQTKTVVSLYVLFLFESSVGFVEVLATERKYRMGAKAMRSLLILTLGAAISSLSIMAIVWFKICWPIGLIVCICAVEKFDVELFKKDELSYFDQSRFTKVPIVL